jgi:hypothetical protein
LLEGLEALLAAATTTNGDHRNERNRDEPDRAEV